MSDYQGNIVIKNPATPTGPAATGRAPGMWKLSDVAYWIKQGVWPDANIIPDQFFPYVSLLLSTTSLGNANNNMFVDSSGAFNPVTRFGNTAQGTFSPYGANWSNYFDGSSDWLSFAATSGGPLDLRSGDFTIELWFNTATTSNQALITQWDNVQFSIETNNGSITFAWAPFSIFSVLLSGSGATVGQWNHVAVTRSGSTFSLFINGTLVQTATSSATASNTGITYIGIQVVDGNLVRPLTGFVSNVRVVKGTAVYTSSFTVPTAPLTAISGTSLLTCQSNRFRDASSNNLTVTRNGDVAVQDFSPFSPAYPGAVYNQSDTTNWSGFFNGGTDRVQVPVTSNMYLGTTYTIEAWAYYNSTSYGARPIFSETEAFQGGFAGLNLTLNTSGQLVAEYRPGTSGTVTTITGPTVTPYTWFHIALVSDNSSAKLYVNGTQVGSTTTFGDYPSAKTSFVAVGSWGHGWNDPGIPAAAWIGYISNLRVVKGVAVYTSNFTPSTSPLTAVSGTVLLTCQNAAFTDNSSVNNVLTPVSNATVTGNSPFNTLGYWSNYFNVSGYLRSTNSAFALGTNNFTMEMWVNFDKPTKTGGGQHNMMWVNYDAWGANAIFFGKHGDIGGYVAVFIHNYNSGSSPILQDPTLPTSGWMHYALVRNGSNWALYRNGVSVATASWSGNATSSTTSSVGGNAENSSVYGMEGYISNFRLTNTAVYTGNFTPSTTPLTAISGTQFLTCQSSRYIDSSTNAISITPTNSVQVQSFDPFYTSTIVSGGGSMYFDGNGDYLSIPNGPSVILSNSVYTLEAWVYPTGDRSAFRTIFVKRAGDPTPCAWQVSLATSTGNLIFYNGTLYNSGVAVPLNAWSHVAAVYDGTNINLYLNGSRVLQSAMTNADCNANAQIGYFFSSVQEPFIGYIANARILKGTQAYTGATYTIPTAPANPTPNTTVMVNGMNAGIYDATTINDMETIGNAQVSTVQSKFGGSSVYLNGSSYLTAPSSPTFNFGTSNFTVEFWINASASGSYTQVVGTLVSGTEEGTWRIGNRFNSGNEVYFARGNGSGYDEFRAAVNVNDGAWHHVAVTRASGTVRIFIDGILGASASISGTCTSTNPLRVGYNQRDNAYVTGYIDDLRITRGVARYTSNFTPPTQAFPVY